MASSVLDEILSLDKKKLGNRFMASLCMLLEDSEVLLETMGQREWLTSSLSVRQMEDLLPSDEKVRWAEKMDSYPGLTKYEKFKAFLKERKIVSEKMKSIGRGNNDSKPVDPSQPGERVKGVCDFCKKGDHKFSTCEDKIKYCRDNKLCFKCLESHDFRKPCPNKGGAGPRVGAGGKDNGGRGKKGGKERDQAINSNSLRPADCLRCK